MNQMPATEIIKSARASLLVPSRPKTPMPYIVRHRIRILRPLVKELNGLDHANIEDVLENGCISSKVSIILQVLQAFKTLDKSTVEKAWNVLAKISAMDQCEDEIWNLGGLEIIMLYMNSSVVTAAMLKTLRNLSFSTQNHDILTQNGVFNLLDNELKDCIYEKNEAKMILLTEIYRNLASNPQNSTNFLNFFSILENNDLNSKNVWFNIQRICSKLSLDQSIPFNGFWISKFKNLLVENIESRDFILRILYTLGNLTVNLRFHSHFYDYDLFVIFKFYMANFDEEVLVKITRLITNLALDPKLGKQLSLNMDLLLVQDLLYSEDEELVLNALACIANYTFFKDEGNIFLKDNHELIKTTIRLILTDHEEITTQGMRIICNISNTEQGKQALKSNLEILFTFLEHTSRDVVFYTACTILNCGEACSDMELLKSLKQEWSDDDEIQNLIQFLILNST